LSGCPALINVTSIPRIIFYIGGLTFLSLNDVHWQCEVQAFGNFFECLRAMMQEKGDWKQNTPFDPSLVRFLSELFPQMDERDRFAEIFRRFEAKEFEGLAITLKEAAFMKLFCDAYRLIYGMRRGRGEGVRAPSGRGWND
jgi:hypothetical protein